MSATASQPCQLKYFWSTSSLTPAVMLHANMWIWIHVKQLVWPHLQPLGSTVSWKAILFNQWITTVTVVNPLGRLLVAFRTIYAFVFRWQTEIIFVTFRGFFWDVWLLSFLEVYINRFTLSTACDGYIVKGCKFFYFHASMLSSTPTPAGN